MCPSFRATRNEQDATRGRANTLRLTISGQIPGGLASEAKADTMRLCASCKARSHECPTDIGMARMKIEVLAVLRGLKGLTLAEKLVAYIPRYAPKAARIVPLMNLRNRIGLLRKWTEGLTGVAHRRDLPV
jgi:Fe-S oxidoreductase